MLNELKIKEYCDACGFSYRYFYNTAVVMTGVDKWRITEVEKQSKDDVICKIIVAHVNKAGNKSGKMQFHTQRVAQDIDWIFENIIIPHENYDKSHNKAFRVKELLAQA